MSAAQICNTICFLPDIVRGCFVEFCKGMRAGSESSRIRIFRQVDGKEVATALARNTEHVSFSQHVFPGGFKIHVGWYLLAVPRTTTDDVIFA